MAQSSWNSHMVMQCCQRSLWEFCLLEVSLGKGKFVPLPQSKRQKLLCINKYMYYRYLWGKSALSHTSGLGQERGFWVGICCCPPRPNPTTPPISSPVCHFTRFHLAFPHPIPSHALLSCSVCCLFAWTGKLRLSHQHAESLCLWNSCFTGTYLW